MLTRRHFLTASAATLALPFAPRRLWAGASATLGDMQIDTLSDGNLTLPGDFILGGMPQDEMQAIVTKYGLPTDQLTPPCNVTLLRDGINTVLFDVGAGPDFQPSAGKLMEAFDALGLTVDDVTHVLFTHAHPDHIWGLLDEFDEPMFPNADYMIGQTEFDYWMDPETVAHDELLQGKAGYLNPTFFLVRAAIFLGGWIAYREISRRLSLAQDKADDHSNFKKNFKWSAAFLVFYLVTPRLLAWH